MATIAQQQDDEDQNNQNGSTISVSGSGGAGSNGQGAGAAAVVSPVQQNQAPQPNQGYTDVASYLNANQGGSQKLGEQVASNLSKKYSDTKSGVDQSYNQFQGQVNQGYVPENTDLISQVAANPTAAAGNSQTLADFQKQLNNTYSGPTAWGDYGTQQGKVNEASQYGNLANTPGGLNVYAQEVEGQTGGPMSGGINQLDTLLLGGDPNAMAQVKGAATPFKDLNDYINQQNMAGSEAVKGAQTAAQTGSQHALDAFTGANGTLTNLNSQVNNQASTAQAKALEQQKALQTALSSLYSQPVDTSTTTLGTYGGGSTPWYNSTNYNVGDLAPENLEALGIDQNQWQALRNAMQQAGSTQFHAGHNFGANSPTSQVNLEEWLSGRDPNTINAATVASGDQYAQMDAIQKLLGSKTPQDLALNPMMANLAGTAPKSLTDFNYQNALDYTNTLENEQEKAAQDMAMQLTGQANKAHADSQHGGFMDKLKNLLPIVNPVAYTTNSTILKKLKGQ